MGCTSFNIIATYPFFILICPLLSVFFSLLVKILATIYTTHQMSKSKFRKSMLRLNQNSPEVSQHLAFLPLLSLSKGQLTMHQQGLSVIQEQSSGRTYLLALYSRTPALINAIYRNNKILQEDRVESGVWITNYPRYDSANHRYFLFLHVVARAPEDAALLHAFCSVICSAVLLDLVDLASFEFLAGLSSRVIFSAKQKDESVNTTERRKEITNIVFLLRSKTRQVAGEMRRGGKEMEDVCAQYSIPGVIRDLHRQVSLLKLSSDAFESENVAYLTRLQEELRQAAGKSAKNEDLRNGPVLREYVELVGQALGRSGSIDISATTDSIRISQGYHAYLRAAENYHSGLRRQLREEGVRNLPELLQAAREEAVEEFRQKSNDAAYLLRLEQHINETEQRLTEQNNKALDLRNLAYLQKASESLLSRSASNRLQADQVQKEIESIVEGYKGQAAGDNKYEILTNYISLLHQSISKNQQNEHNSETVALKKELESARKQINDLETTLRQERSKSCCQIM